MDFSQQGNIENLETASILVNLETIPIRLAASHFARSLKLPWYSKPLNSHFGVKKEDDTKCIQYCKQGAYEGP